MGRGNGFYSDKYWNSARWNRRKAEAYLDQLEALALNRIHWEGLPPSVDARYLEYILLTAGVATIAQPVEYPGIWVCGMVSANGTINRYGNPTQWDCLGADGDRFHVTPFNGVLIYDSETRKDPWTKLDMWARELADIDRTRDLNRAHLKNPLIIEAPRGKKAAAQEIMKAWLGGESSVAVYESLEAHGIKLNALSFNIPFQGEALFRDAMNVLNRVYTFLGIENLPTKAERMIQEEIASSMEPASVNALNYLNARNQGAQGLWPLGLPDAKARWHYGKYGEIPLYGGGVE